MFHLVRGSVYLLVVLRASFSFLYTGLVTLFTYIVLIFNIYVCVCVCVCVCVFIMCIFFTYLSMCCFFSLFIHMFLMYAIFYFCFTLRYLDEFCLKCFKNTGCQSLSCHELSSCKVFQDFVLGLDFIVFNK